ncbi:MAG: hypothetical protein K8R90_10760 [Candidatus Cloacimonetes bacterium]|nr:hypothetical protein [Candidatus Cloacimonadota bacterium]
MKVRITLLLLLLCLSGMLFARGDARVPKLLDQIGVDYELDDDGDYQLYYAWNDGRSQLIWIRGVTEDFHGMEVREVFSYAYDSDGPMPANVARHLLSSNAGYKIGAWELRVTGDTNYGIFVARIGTDMNASSLEHVLDAVSVTADEMEKELLGTDDW